MKYVSLLLFAASALCSSESLVLTPISGTAVTIGVPASWRSVPVTADAGLVRKFIAPGNDGGLAVSLSPLNTGEGPAAFTERCLADVRQLAQEFDLVDWDFTELIAGRTWSRLHLRLTIRQQRWEQQLWLTTEPASATSPGLGIAVAYAATPATWPRWSELFQLAVRNPEGSTPVLLPR